MTRRAERHTAMEDMGLGDTLAKLIALFPIHGDRVVAMALVGKLGRALGHRIVLERLCALATDPGALWTRFKSAGGVSKELDTIGGLPEHAQGDALQRTWDALPDGPANADVDELVAQAMQQLLASRAAPRT